MTDATAPASEHLTPSHMLLALAINACWGLNVIAIKYAVDEIPPLFATAARFGLVMLICLPWLRVIRGRMLPIISLGLLFGTLHFGLIFWAVELAGDAGVLAVVGQVGVPMSVLMAMLVLREYVSARRWAGIGLTFLGVALLGFDPRVIDYLDAVGMMVLAGFIYGVSALLMRRLSGVKPLELQAWIGLISLPCLLALSQLAGEDGFAQAATASWPAWGAILFSAIAASMAGHAGMFYLLQRYPVAFITPYSLLVPLVALGAGVVLLNEVITPLIAMGALVTIAGVVVITRGRQ